VSTEPNDPDDRPWERPGAIRYDCPLHRGDLLLFLGKFCLFFGIVSFLLPPVAIFALLGGGIVGQLAINDLYRIRAGEMDPGGDVPVRKAKKIAELGIILGGIGAVFWPGLLMIFAVVIRLAEALRNVTW
jgi:hypothetical protein